MTPASTYRLCRVQPSRRVVEISEIQQRMLMLTPNISLCRSARHTVRVLVADNRKTS
jgi:hypothetical protein